MFNVAKTGVHPAVLLVAEPDCAKVMAVAHDFASILPVLMLESMGGVTVTAARLA